MADRNNTDPNNGVGILFVKPTGTNLTYIVCAVDLPALIPYPEQTGEGGYAMQAPVLSSVGPEGIVISYIYYWNSGDGVNTGYYQDPVNYAPTLVLPVFTQQLDLSAGTTVVTVQVTAMSSFSGKSGQGTVSTIKFKGDFEIPGMPSPADQHHAVKVFEEKFEDTAGPAAWQLRPFTIQSVTQPGVYYVCALTLTDALNSYDNTWTYNFGTESSLDNPPKMGLNMQQPLPGSATPIVPVTLIGMFPDISSNQLYPWNYMDWDNSPPTVYTPVTNPQITLSPYNTDPTIDTIRAYPNIVTL